MQFGFAPMVERRKQSDESGETGSDGYGRGGLYHQVINGIIFQSYHN